MEEARGLSPAIPNVRTHTNNSAELLGFTRALQWAARSPHTADPATPVVIRYDSCYASMVGSGTWKGRRHHELVSEARTAWDTLKSMKGELLWLRHVRGHSNHQWNNRADELATRGKEAGGGVYAARWEAPFAVD